MRFVRTAIRAELLELEATSGGLLVLGVRVIAVLTLRALKGDDFSWHDLYPENA